MVKLFSASRLINYIRNDAIIDLINIKKRKKNSVDDSFKPKENIVKRKRASSFDFIMEIGNNFEYCIIEEIKNRMKNKKKINELHIIDKKDKSNSDLFKETKKLILSKKPCIILNGLLIDYDKKTFGSPDLIVKGSWIKKYITEFQEDLIDDKYYIIDIKSSLINLINCGSDVSFSSIYDGYKAQVYIYKEILDNIQNFNDNSYGFILGKKYKYVINNEVIVKNSFDILGKIDYFLEGNSDLKESIVKSIKWNEELEKEWKTYSLNPISKEELYPNMTNKYDGQCGKEKMDVALQNKEITLLWNCGIKERKNALNNNISRYDDKKLNADILGFNNNGVKHNIINKMLEIIHKDNKIIIPKENNYMDWRKELKNEYYVDFETYNNEYCENSEYINEQKLYMIGIGNYNRKWIHKTFLINNNFNKNNKNTILCKNEEELIKKFITYIKENNIGRLIHWSKAEPIVFTKKLKQYNIKEQLKWYDLLEVFKNRDYPIIIKECFGFGLKEIINKLNEYDFINIKWNKLDDGLLSMFMANEIYKNTYDNKQSNDKMKSLIEYNEIDCKTLQVLLKFIREYD
jgi:hypothetical protein